MELTDEQKAIIKCVKRGLTNIEIGEELGYSPDTIKKYLNRIYRLFNVRGRIALMSKLFLYATYKRENS